MRSLARTWSAVLVPALCLVAVPLLAQADTTVHDRTGIFGPIIDHVWPVVVTFLTSLAVKAVSMANAGFAKTSAPVKWVALYIFALLFNVTAGRLNITGVDPLAPVLGLSLVQTTAAALVYRFGSHKVPTTTV